MKAFIKKRIFLINVLLKMLIPPFYSFDRLEKYCKKRIMKNPKFYLPRWFLAGLYKDYKKDREAKNEYLEIKQLGQMDDKDYLGLGEVLFRLEEYDGVVDTLVPVIDKFPKHKNANWCLGRSYMKKEEYQKAAIYLEKVILAGSTRYEDYWHLGYCYDRVGKLIKAKEHYSNALSLKPDAQELKQNIAAIESKLQITNAKNN